MIAIRIFLTLLITGYSIHSNGQNRVKTHESVIIGGIEQWIGAQGDDDRKPLLLFLHGGPGFSSRTYSKKFISQLKTDFIVVQWDQRNTGITKAWSGVTDSTTLALMHADTEEVINYLLKKFQKEKLFLAGFSWGGFLGLHFANTQPERLHAYISVSGLIHGEGSENMTLDVLRTKANKTNINNAISDLSDITIPFENWQDLYTIRKWTAHYTSGKSSKKYYPAKLFKEWSTTWMPLFLEASAVDFRTEVPIIKCPIFFFVSRKDLVANFAITEDYYQMVEAPQKDLIWFESSSHEIPSEEPKKFSAELIAIQKRIDLN